MSIILTGTSTSWITPAVRRLHFQADDLSSFAESVFTDRYVKLVFSRPGIDYPHPLDMKMLRSVVPPEDMPHTRTYTALFPDVTPWRLTSSFTEMRESPDRGQRKPASATPSF